MSTQLSSREKVLASIVGGAVAIFLSIFIISYFLRNNVALRNDLVMKRGELQGLQTLLADAPMWQERDNWLRAHQPRTDNPDKAGSMLLDQVKQAATRHTVTISQPAIAVPDRRPEYTAVSVNVEAKCLPKDLVAFLYEIQGPDKFVVFEDAHLQIDSTDPTKMLAKFRIAKWYAPK